MVSTLSRGSSKSSTQIKRKWNRPSQPPFLITQLSLDCSLWACWDFILRKELSRCSGSGSTKMFARCYLFIYLPIDPVTAPEAPGYGEQLSTLRRKTNKDLQWLSHYGEGLFSKFSFSPNLKKKGITFSTRKQRQADIEFEASWSTEWDAVSKRG